MTNEQNDETNPFAVSSASLRKDGTPADQILQARISTIHGKVKIGWAPALRVWWSAAWRGMIYGFLGGIVLGAVVGFIAAASGHADKVAQYAALGGYLLALPLSMFALKQALETHARRLASLVNES